MAHLLLADAKTIGAGNSIQLSKPVSDHTVAVDYVDADSTISNIVVALQGSVSNRGESDSSAKWFDLAAYTFTSADRSAKSAMFHVVSRPVNRVRLNIITLNGADTNDFVNARYTPKYD